MASTALPNGTKRNLPSTSQAPPALENFQFNVIGKPPELLKRFSALQDPAMEVDPEPEILEYIEESTQSRPTYDHQSRDHSRTFALTRPMSGVQDHPVLDQPPTQTMVPSSPVFSATSPVLSTTYPPSYQPGPRHSTTPEQTSNIRDRAAMEPRPLAPVVVQSRLSPTLSPPQSTDFTPLRQLQARLLSSVASLTPVTTASALLLTQSAKEQSSTVARLAHKACDTARQALATAQTAVIAAEECLTASKTIESRVNEALLAVERINSSEGASEWRWNEAIEVLQNDLHTLSQWIAQQEAESRRQQMDWERKQPRSRDPTLQARSVSAATAQPSSAPPRASNHAGPSRPQYTKENDVNAANHAWSAQNDERQRQFKEEQRKRIAAERALEEERGRARAEAVAREQAFADQRAKDEEIRLKEEKRRADEQLAQEKLAAANAEAERRREARAAADREKIRQRLEREKAMALTSMSGVALPGPSSTNNQHTLTQNPSPTSQQNQSSVVPSTDATPPAGTSTPSTSAPIAAPPLSKKARRKAALEARGQTQPITTTTAALQVSIPPANVQAVAQPSPRTSHPAAHPPSNANRRPMQGSTEAQPPNSKPPAQAQRMDNLVVVKNESAVVTVPQNLGQPAALPSPPEEPVVKTEAIVEDLPPAPAVTTASAVIAPIPKRPALAQAPPPESVALRTPPSASTPVSLPPKPNVHPPSTPAPHSHKDPTPMAPPKSVAPAHMAMDTRQEHQAPTLIRAPPLKNPSRSNEGSNYGSDGSGPTGRPYYNDHYSPGPPARRSSPPPRRSNPPPRRQSPPPRRVASSRFPPRGDHYSPPESSRRSLSPPPSRSRPRPPPTSYSREQNQMDTTRPGPPREREPTVDGQLIGRKRPRNEEPESGPLRRRFVPQDRPGGPNADQNMPTSHSSSSLPETRQQRPSPRLPQQYPPQESNAYGHKNGNGYADPGSSNLTSAALTPPPSGTSMYADEAPAPVPRAPNPPPLAMRIDTERAIGNYTPDSQVSDDSYQSRTEWSGQAPSGPRAMTSSGGGGARAGAGAGSGGNTNTNTQPTTDLLHRFEPLPTSRHPTSPRGRGSHHSHRGGRGGSRGSPPIRATSYGRHQSSGRSLFERLEQ